MSESDPNLSMKVGEVSGQLREVIHTLNGVSAKVDALGREIGPITTLATEVSDLKRRVGELEVVNSERRGAVNIIGATIHSPVVGWLVAAAIGIGSYFGVQHEAAAVPPRPARPMASVP